MRAQPYLDYMEGSENTVPFRAPVVPDWVLKALISRYFFGTLPYVGSKMVLRRFPGVMGCKGLTHYRPSRFEVWGSRLQCPRIYVFFPQKCGCVPASSLHFGLFLETGPTNSGSGKLSVSFPKSGDPSIDPNI